MGFFTWIRGLGRRGFNAPLSTAQLIRYWAWENEQVRVAFSEGAVQQGNGNGGPVTPKPPIKPQPTGGRLIYSDRDPGPVNQPAPAPPLPTPGADPVATDEELMDICWGFNDNPRRALYQRGRADERIAILRALGVEP